MNKPTVFTAPVIERIRTMAAEGAPRDVIARTLKLKLASLEVAARKRRIDLPPATPTKRSRVLRAS